MASGIGRSALSFFFEYDTPMMVHVKSKRIGAVNRLVQLCIIVYVIGFAIIYKKGYQNVDYVKSAVTTKVKGVAFTDLPDVPGIGKRIWDVADYVIPPQENNAFFVMTNMIVTPNQTLSSCDEAPIPAAICNVDADCPPNTPVPGGNGYRTGKCVNSTQEIGIKVCQVYAWCPLENDKDIPNPARLLESENFTVFIKNNVAFPKFEVKRRNIIGFYNNTDLGNCRFSLTDPKNKFCPIFILGDIVGFAGGNYKTMAQMGGVIQIIISWDCNLDHGNDECAPEYSFRRLDSDEYKVSKGYNFRFADKFKVDDELQRTLVKAYGIRFIITVEGQAGKFGIDKLLLNIGSGLALFAIATVVSDIVLLHLVKMRLFYRDKKYLIITGDDAYGTMSGDVAGV